VNYADLHLHTLFSDGTYSVAELIAKSAEAGLSAISLTDHDSVSGIREAIETAAGPGIEVLPGIELSTEYNAREVHILGYLFDYQNEALLRQLAALKKNRIERIYKIVEKLKLIGVDLPAESVFGLAGNGTVGRLHVARAMLKEGITGSIFEAFQKYIGDKCPAYVLGFRLSPEEAINLIKQAGGIPVLAHPYLINDDSVIKRFIESGLRGLEVYYPEHSQSLVNFYLDFAQKNNLLVTGGSDCHGSAKPEVRVGSIKIPYTLVEKLKQAKEKLC